jgi:two-component system phosphate regulon response regulator PhoB
VGSKRILLVDDYADALEIWGLYLRSCGYDVVTAADGLEALEKAHRLAPDIIVLDLELPGITGFEAAARLKNSAQTAAIPLIAATGYSHPTQLAHARACGFDSIVLKPCEPMALVAEIERLFEEKRGPDDQRQSTTVQRLRHNR